jgi:hypothetical protein
LALVIAVTAASMLGVNNVFAEQTKYNQASSQADACGNGEFPMNVLCQNLGSEIQGEGNAVNVISLQAGGKILREVPDSVV